MFTLFSQMKFITTTIKLQFTIMETTEKLKINATLTHDKLVLKSVKEGVYYKEYELESLLDNFTIDDIVLLNALLKLNNKYKLLSDSTFDIKIKKDQPEEITIRVSYYKTGEVIFECDTEGVFYRKKHYYAPLSDYIQSLCNLREIEKKKISKLYPKSVIKMVTVMVNN